MPNRSAGAAARRRLCRRHLERHRAEVDAEQHGARLFLVLDSGPLFRSRPGAGRGPAAPRRATVQALAGFRPARR
jgi:hypothetical protein